MAGNPSVHSLPVRGRTHRRLLRALLIIVFCLAAVKTAIPLLDGFLVVNSRPDHADALVVMAGSMNERLPAAAQLYRQGVAPLILLPSDGVLSGWSPEEHRNLMSVEWAKEKLARMQVPARAIVKLPFTASGSIYDALHCRKEIVARGIRSIIIVTSDYHTRRSLWTFSRVLRGRGVTIGCYPAASALSREPDVIRFLDLDLELIKYLYYRLRYEKIPQTGERP